MEAYCCQGYKPSETPNYVNDPDAHYKPTLPHELSDKALEFRQALTGFVELHYLGHTIC
jgi:hypothetical protein